MWIYDRIDEEFNTLPELKEKLRKISEEGWEIISYNEKNNKSKIKATIFMKKFKEDKMIL